MEVIPLPKEQEKSGDDAKVLKELVHRLNAELDKYQRKFRPLTPAEVRLHVIMLLKKYYWECYVCNDPYVPELTNP